MATEADFRGHAGREFFTTRTVAEALAGFRPARRTGAETIPLGEAIGMAVDPLTDTVYVIGAVPA